MLIANAIEADIHPVVSSSGVWRFKTRHAHTVSTKSAAHGRKYPPPIKCTSRISGPVIPHACPLALIFMNLLNMTSIGTDKKYVIKISRRLWLTRDTRP
jgi:hypothetical protein